MLKTKNRKHIYLKGEIYHIKFGDTYAPEIDDVHLGIIFPIKNAIQCFFAYLLPAQKKNILLIKNHIMNEILENLNITDNELNKIIKAMNNFFLKDIINYK